MLAVNTTPLRGGFGQLLRARLGMTKQTEGAILMKVVAGHKALSGCSNLGTGLSYTPMT
jgi:hypothetical protein